MAVVRQPNCPTNTHLSLHFLLKSTLLNDAEKLLTFLEVENRLLNVENTIMDLKLNSAQRSPKVLAM
jgi:hypothetical protein